MPINNRVMPINLIQLNEFDISTNAKDGVETFVYLRVSIYLIIIIIWYIVSVSEKDLDYVKEVLLKTFYMHGRIVTIIIILKDDIV